MNASERLLQECAALWAPPPRESLSEWAEANFRLSPEYSAQTGELHLYQFQRGMLDAFTDPYVREIVCMTAVQMIKTLLLQCIVSYVMAREPGPILLAQPTETDAETFSKERLTPMLRDMECLRGIVAPEKKTSSANTTLHKVFRGGSLSLIGAQTAGNFARRSIRYFLADERDKWKKNVGKEGDGYSLGVERTSTFRSLAKLVQVCSPTVEGNSQIAEAYERSDQRKFWVPCPECGEFQILKWESVVWDSALPRDQQAASSRYKCFKCDARWNDVQRWSACESGEWRADQPFAGVAGFWISGIYSPWKTLSKMVADFLAKKDDPSLLQTFVNTTLAETWKETGDAPDHEKLMVRCEEYRLGEVPDGALILTAGVDVQKTWMQGHVWGWGRDRQRWIVDRFIIEGDPFHDKLWNALTDRLDATYRTAAGASLSITRMAVDTGYATQECYRWAKQHPGRVMSVKGVASGASLVATPTQVEVSFAGKKLARGAKLYPVNVSMAKSELYGLLAKERPEAGEPYPSGWVHFAKDLDEEFFRQLTAEQLVTHVVKGYRKHEWVKSRERNEDLDCANYARAAASVIGVDRIDEKQWRALEASLAPKLVAAAPKPTRPPERRQEPDWLGGRGNDWF